MGLLDVPGTSVRPAQACLHFDQAFEPLSGRFPALASGRFAGNRAFLGFADSLFRWRHRTMGVLPRVQTQDFTARTANFQVNQRGRGENAFTPSRGKLAAYTFVEGQNRGREETRRIVSRNRPAPIYDGRRAARGICGRAAARSAARSEKSSRSAANAGTCFRSKNAVGRNSETFGGF